ncbi:5',5'''-p-1,p-4-tetraphosphate phosphorylase, partial [Globisporangium splendens]
MRKTVLEVTQRATQTQALKKITAGHELLPPAENGIRYVLFQAQTANQKPVASAPAATATESPAPEKKPFHDPFAKEHLEQDLFITQLHGTHNLVLNKFNVVDEHVVLPTIEFEEQETPLSKADFRAMWTAMGSLDAFAFFNCGYESGASQPHKHMQLISYPSMKSYTNLDMPPLLQFIHDRLQTEASDGTVHLRELPFFHFLHRIDLPADIDDQVAADQLHAIYATVLQQLNAKEYPGQEAMSTTTAGRFVAYNLLLTKSFLFVIPRKTQRFNGIEVNAIGFIGSFFVRNDEQRAFFQTQGPMELLRQVTFPPM